MGDEITVLRRSLFLLGDFRHRFDSVKYSTDKWQGQSSVDQVDYSWCIVSGGEVNVLVSTNLTTAEKSSAYLSDCLYAIAEDDLSQRSKILQKSF